MPHLIRLLILLLISSASLHSQAQQIFRGKVLDAITKEPISGVTLHCADEGCNCGCVSGVSGDFEMHCTNCSSVRVSATGYQPQTIDISKAAMAIALQPSVSLLNTITVTASRGDAVKRSEAPIAITSLSARTIQDTKSTTVDQLLNKVSGVQMVNLGNEQHQMSIRQPMTTKSLFLYLEDGIPVRTTGLFNHNALLEMNMASVKNIEVIKGPSSSLYGSEAIGGVVNFITQAPTATPLAKISVQTNNLGYKRADIQTGITAGKFGFALSGYYADKRNSFIEFTDFHKGTITTRADYRFSKKTVLSNSLTALRYYSDMPSGVDSLMFATHSFTSPQTFTYRKVDATRYHSTLTHNWNDRNKSVLSFVYRNNTIGQNPAYRIKDDYKKTGNTWTGKKDLAHGEINESSFHSISLIAQHRLKIDWKNTVINGGISTDLSPSAYEARYIRIKKDTVSRKYVSYLPTDSTLTNYSTGLNNYAAFASLEFSPLEKLRIVASLRYDLFHYDFDNHLKPSAFSGSPDTANRFSRISPKIGFTWSLSARSGIYANYSEGFVPPQVTEMYTGVKVPNLNPSVFYNYEAGGWIEIIRNRLSADVSAYLLKGTNEIISVKLDDGSSENRNAGRTGHKGIEFGLQGNPLRDLSLRISGAYSEHRFEEFVEKGSSYNGKEMNGAPRWLYNAEAWYRPSFLKGFRIGAEWQHVGSYFMDPQNTVRYNGYDALNLRTGYQLKGFEVWVNVMNATNNYYSYISSKSSSGYSYQLAEPRNFNVGISYDLGQLAKK
jgi:iron complex outermembrane receptor protein